jgi:hypothetical protein
MPSDTGLERQRTWRASAVLLATRRVPAVLSYAERVIPCGRNFVSTELAAVMVKSDGDALEQGGGLKLPTLQSRSLST